MADSSKEQHIAELETSATGRRQAKEAIRGNCVWLPVAGAFLLLCVLVWLNEVLDIPHFLLGAPSTPINWREAIGETVMLALVGFLVVSRLARDIAKRERAEQSLRESEERLSAVAEFTYDWEYWIDPDGNYVYVSPSCERITGYNADTLLQNPELLKSIVHPDDWEIFANHQHEVLETGEVLPIDFRIVTRSGEERWIGHVCQPVYSGDGRYLGQRGSNRDITARKRAEQSLRRRNRVRRALVSTLDLNQLLDVILEEIRRLLGVTSSSIWLTDPKTGELVCLQSIGPKNEIVRGWRLSPGQGIAGWVICHGESLIVPDAWADDRYFKGVDEQTGLGLRSILTVPMRVKGGMLGVLQVLDTEVGRFSAAELELLESLISSASIAIENARLYEQAQRDAKTKSTLLREINHRVKNNLTAIMGMIYTARNHDRVKNQAACQSTMNDLLGRVRGLSTVHSMLSVSEWTPLRLSDLAAQVIRAALEGRPRGKRVSVDVSPSPLFVTPDEAHNLALVINELAANSVKYALAGRDAAHISFQIALAGGVARCEFRDDGPGYPEDVLRLERCNVGFDMIRGIARCSLRGELSLRNDGGAVTVVQFTPEGGNC